MCNISSAVIRWQWLELRAVEASGSSMSNTSTVRASPLMSVTLCKLSYYFNVYSCVEHICCIYYGVYYKQTVYIYPGIRCIHEANLTCFSLAVLPKVCLMLSCRMLESPSMLKRWRSHTQMHTFVHAYMQGCYCKLLSVDIIIVEFLSIS